MSSKKSGGEKLPTLAQVQVQGVRVGEEGEYAAQCVSPFLMKLSQMLNSAEHAPYIVWSPNGTKVVIKQVVEFGNIVLPKFFKHSNFESFLRQMNTYNFNTARHERNMREFVNPLFRKGRPDLLTLIIRKGSRRSQDTHSSMHDRDGAILTLRAEVVALQRHVFRLDGAVTSLLADNARMKHSLWALARAQQDQAASMPSHPPAPPQFLSAGAGAGGAAPSYYHPSTGGPHHAPSYGVVLSDPAAHVSQGMQRHGFAVDAGGGSAGAPSYASVASPSFYHHSSGAGQVSVELGLSGPTAGLSSAAQTRSGFSAATAGTVLRGAPNAAVPAFQAGHGGGMTVTGHQLVQGPQGMLLVPVLRHAQQGHGSAHPTQPPVSLGSAAQQLSSQPSSSGAPPPPKKRKVSAVSGQSLLL